MGKRTIIDHEGILGIACRKQGLNKQKISLENQLQHKSTAMVKTDVWFGQYWEKEFRLLEEIDRINSQNKRLWTICKSDILDEIESFKQENAQLKTDIQSLEDKLKTALKNLYLVRNS
jgi:hypothetical protein